MKVNYYSISEIDPKELAGIDLRDADAATLQANPVVAEHFYSFTTLRPHSDGKIYIGTTNGRNRILWSFDPVTKSFEDLGYAKVGTQYDIKIHRSLEYDPVDDALYGVSAGLHRENEYSKAPGSEVFKYDLKTKRIEMLGIPLRHEYTQTIRLDPKRRLLYGFTYHNFAFYVFDIEKKKTIYQAMPGSISHLSAIDDSGCIWSTWGRDEHWIFKYDPEKNDIEWTQRKFPEGGNSHIYPGAGPIDCMLNGGDGFIYVALETGSLVRMNPSTVEFDYLGRPSPFPRMPALVMGDDGLLYGACGDAWNVRVFSFDRKTRGFKILTTLACSDVHCFRPHDIAIMGDKIYVGETDNPKRSGYLWEIERYT